VRADRIRPVLLVAASQPNLPSSTVLNLHVSLPAAPGTAKVEGVDPVNLALVHEAHFVIVLVANDLFHSLLSSLS
jgi:hypothetical protein